jgi:AraC-like DNA-binding protein
MPLRGVFASHAGHRCVRVTTPNDAILLRAGVPHHYTFPGGIGDHSLVLRWSPALLPATCHHASNRDGLDAPQPLPQVSLAPRTIIERTLLWRQAAGGTGDPLALELRAIELLATVLGSVRRPGSLRTSPRQVAVDRRRDQVERVKAAVASDPARAWTLQSLATVAAASPFHLARIFRSQTTVSLYEYVLRMRLACALASVLDSRDGLTDIALRTGFSSHSHLTEKFRTRFGVTPSELRRQARRNVIEGMRTAP